MPVLKDMTCNECGASAEVTVSMDDEHLKMFCCVCNKGTVHSSRCTGGCGHRERVNDWPDDPHFYRGQIVSGAVDAVGSDINTGLANESDPVRDHSTGEIIHERPRFSNNEAREDRRDRLYHKDLVKRGRAPVFWT